MHADDDRVYVYSSIVIFLELFAFFGLLEFLFSCAISVDLVVVVVAVDSLRHASFCYISCLAARCGFVHTENKSLNFSCGDDQARLPSAVGQWSIHSFGYDGSEEFELLCRSGMSTCGF